jgi:hypothetical protein
MVTEYTFEEEKDIREKLRLRELEELSKLNVSAIKMNLERLDRNVNPEMLDMIDILSAHRLRDRTLIKRTKKPNRLINYTRKYSD